jgi:primosomal protein N' (replication factor Y)
VESNIVIPVVVEIPQHATNIPSVLSYLAIADLPVGTLVRVPLGKREVCGIVWDKDINADECGTDATKRHIVSVLSDLPPLGRTWINVVKFIAQYYQRSVGDVALSVLPIELRQTDTAALTKRILRWQQKLKNNLLQPRKVVSSEELPNLSEEQTKAIQILVASTELARKGFPMPPHLLHGSTGSGKTEVYLRLAAEIVKRGKQVLFLVPEINLTPQFEQRVIQRFGSDHVVSLHSGLTPVQRAKNWIQAHTGQADLIIGTRLAILASIPRLGLIVVDEEHDHSYKQQEGARYSARDVAVWRAHSEKIPVILGSATPSLESYRHAQDGRYGWIHMPSRIGNGALPKVRLVDMHLQPQRGKATSILSPPLLAAIHERMNRQEQCLLLLNQRGYAPVLHCHACGWKSACPHCSAWRVFHKSDRTLRCHHCGVTDRVPTACPDCGNLDIGAIGRGTEQLEEQLATLLATPHQPQPRVLRIDADSTRQKGALEAHLNQVHSGEVDVLVGTQMITKGHDFRRVTLVAAINPDGALFSSDFRAAERLFALLMQAAGRAGRDAAQASQSEMLVQTWHPNHPLYASLREYNYTAFAQSQLNDRAMAGLPPFSFLALLRAEARQAQIAKDFLKDAKEAAQAWLINQSLSSDVLMVYPAVPPSLAKVAGVERVQMLIESSSRPILQKFLHAWNPQLHFLRLQHKGLLRWALDVDPLMI